MHTSACLLLPEAATDTVLSGVQTMDPRDEDKFDFDPLDVTKIWPEHLFPLQPVGRMVLNKVQPGPLCFMCMDLLLDNFHAHGLLTRLCVDQLICL